MTVHPAEALLDRQFRKARTHMQWTDKPVDPALLTEAYDLARWAPTAFNASPMRVLFLRSTEAKERLRPLLSPGNVDKTMRAPVTAIVAQDSRFQDHLPTLFPFMDVKPLFDGNPDMAAETAFRNSSLQGAYLIVALRSVGLDVGPMSGFDAEGVNREFFPDGRYRSNFLINIGHGEASALHPRGPRLAFDQIAEII
ncbi:malonic semialdehyde reductase [Oceanibacterium hippocampi]|uniref:Putative NADH dehydrogenase/NAD(P)H nitroreductase OCH7691_02645 n=1 Tax=Oceanibacterium hippocampi TaxID=745714 RepID=A0A1Y5TE99_9PROT|nr:putative malonic semialdehyde reductase RutE [Oceanibacterium hippocampi]